MVERAIADEDWRALAKALEVEEAAIRAVAAVESAGDGFLAPPSQLPKILFEGHAFHRLTGGRFDAAHPTISYPKWSKQFYAKNGLDEWKRLNAACDLDRASALQSASWGAFQIMGFNYALCGFADVEAFVARQRAGAQEQLEAFAQFISRDVFMSALRAHDWAGFAKSYNGPGYAANKYDTKLAAAYAAFRKSEESSTEVGEAALRALAPAARGRKDFTVVPATRRRAKRRPVKVDPVDLRDWLYRPNVSRAPDPYLLPGELQAVADQGHTSACTGFALATCIEYLQSKAKRGVERISGHMLYSMARRYDEWLRNEEKDEGSSLRGALKGWSRHGASALEYWDCEGMPAATNTDTDWWLDSMKRPLGAYYRMTLGVESDLHCALMDVGVLCASALTHAGWDLLKHETVLDPPTSPDDIPLIECRKGDEDGGHAFAIVGYNAKGFIVHNSWGPTWGRGGFGVLTYSDWRQNAMDCWVAQLGVVTLEHQAVARAASLRLDGVEETNKPKRLSGTPAVVLSSEPELANHEISPFVLDMQDDGTLSDRGRFRTDESDLSFLLEHHLMKVACARWGRSEPVDVAVYAHGGLVDENEAARSARQWIPLLYGNRIFPIFLMWETDGLSSVFNLVEGALKSEDQQLGARWQERFRQQLVDWKDDRVEGLTRRPGGALWRQMKENADGLSDAETSGVVLLFQAFRRVAKRRGFPRVRLHLIGHSAGAIVQSCLAPRAVELGFEIASVSLLAPALRVDAFDKSVRHIGAARPRLFVAHLIDSAERADPSCRPYGHSLLYLISRSFEGDHEVELLGMEKHLVPAIASHHWGASVSRLSSPGMSYHPDDPPTTATTHSSLNDDPAVQDAVIRHIKGPGFTGRVVRDRRQLRA